MNLTILLVLLAFECSVCLCDYWADRAKLIEDEHSQILGSSITLTPKEEVVNKKLIKIKSDEYDKGFNNVLNFLPSQHFFKTKAQVESSEVFKFIQKVPKGADLHAHDSAIVSDQFLFNLTYRSNLYACFQNGSLRLRFFSTPNLSCNWTLLATLRQADPSINDLIRSRITLVVDNPETRYRTEREIWAAFLNVLDLVTPVITYRPVFEDYFYRALEELYEDNVIYMELRGLLPQVYELNGTVYDGVDVAGLYVNVLKKFKQDYPDFVGAKFIYTPLRSADNVTAWKYVETLKALKKRYPDFVIGFDLAGEEERGFPLKNFIPQLTNIQGSLVKIIYDKRL
ncbi:adenosine deaminase 2-A-like [Agrilus planipennis]|uniref:Adenosine deaminase 2-A-like n=1 Tax=Agrilus planipennis TaxID=224129 RepID=A0A1W4XQ00_AGRPL|nr:adenosine deaminase 2-A-like [Agrilus planipennis]